ncbi:serine/threonine protein kinase psk1 [Cladochytrium tenue]|nr:serine/threonine protein kinase psk1 [Cladochytrium tenue]
MNTPGGGSDGVAGGTEDDPTISFRIGNFELLHDPDVAATTAVATDDFPVHLAAPSASSTATSATPNLLSVPSAPLVVPGGHRRKSSVAEPPARSFEDVTDDDRRELLGEGAADTVDAATRLRELAAAELVAATALQQKKISMDDFDLLKVVGRGAYGKVFLVRRKDTPRLYAMKVLRKATLTLHTKTAEHTKNERSILERIQHPFIVKLWYAFQSPSKVFLILSYAPGGELFSYLASERMFSEDVAAFYTGELLLALDHLHSLGIIYRDLKPENVLLDATGHVVLTDFGLSKVALKTETLCGTIEFTAPEVLDTKVHYGHGVDHWSLGVMLFDMLTGAPPFTGNNRKKIMEAILNKKPTFPNYLSSFARDILVKLLRKDPLKRLGSGPTRTAEIQAHAFYRKINWQDLLARRVVPPIVPTITDPLDTSNFDDVFTHLPVTLESSPESSPRQKPKKQPAAAAAASKPPPPLQQPSKAPPPSPAPRGAATTPIPPPSPSGSAKPSGGGGGGGGSSKKKKKKGPAAGRNGKPADSVGFNANPASDPDQPPSSPASAAPSTPTLLASSPALGPTDFAKTTATGRSTPSLLRLGLDALKSVSRPASPSPSAPSTPRGPARPAPPHPDDNPIAAAPAVTGVAGAPVSPAAVAAQGGASDADGIADDGADDDDNADDEADASGIVIIMGKDGGAPHFQGFSFVAEDDDTHNWGNRSYWDKS